MKSCFNFLLFLFLPALIVFNSCSNKVDVLAPYEENAAIYGLLDPNQDTQFIKINKIFINPNSKASDVAQIADSLYFDSITPTITELETGKVFPLLRVNSIKDKGYFANTPNYLYYTAAPINAFRNYRFDMELPSSHKKISATTNIARNTALYQPITANLRNMSILPDANIVLAFFTQANGKIYDSYFYFNYEEVNNADTNVKTQKTIKWKILRSYRTVDDQGNESVVERIPGMNFYNILLTEIKKNVDVTRRFKPCVLELIAGNEELDNFIQASTPSIGIVQKETDYSNISNAVGLFASRNTLHIDNVILTNKTRAIIATDTAYKNLGFQQ